jgi:hypothetical protein
VKLAPEVDEERGSYVLRRSPSLTGGPPHPALSPVGGEGRRNMARRVRMNA